MDISTCPDKFTWGLSFDDGPFAQFSALVLTTKIMNPPLVGPAEYSPKLLNYLNDQKLQATFFVVSSYTVPFLIIMSDSSPRPSGWLPRVPEPGPPPSGVPARPSGPYRSLSSSSHCTHCCSQSSSPFIPGRMWNLSVRAAPYMNAIFFH